MRSTFAPLLEPLLKAAEGVPGSTGAATVPGGGGAPKPIGLNFGGGGAGGGGTNPYLKPATQPTTVPPGTLAPAPNRPAAAAPAAPAPAQPVQPNANGGGFHLPGPGGGQPQPQQQQQPAPAPPPAGGNPFLSNPYLQGPPKLDPSAYDQQTLANAGTSWAGGTPPPEVAARWDSVRNPPWRPSVRSQMSRDRWPNVPFVGLQDPTNTGQGVPGGAMAMQNNLFAGTLANDFALRPTAWGAGQGARLLTGSTPAWLGGTSRFLGGASHLGNAAAPLMLNYDVTEDGSGNMNQAVMSPAMLRMLATGKYAPTAAPGATALGRAGAAGGRVLPYAYWAAELGKEGYGSYARGKELDPNANWLVATGKGNADRYMQLTRANDRAAHGSWADVMAQAGENMDHPVQMLEHAPEVVYRGGQAINAGAGAWSSARDVNAGSGRLDTALEAANAARQQSGATPYERRIGSTQVDFTDRTSNAWQLGFLPDDKRVRPKHLGTGEVYEDERLLPQRWQVARRLDAARPFIHPNLPEPYAHALTAVFDPNHPEYNDDGAMILRERLAASPPKDAAGVQQAVDAVFGPNNGPAQQTAALRQSAAEAARAHQRAVDEAPRTGGGSRTSCFSGLPQGMVDTRRCHAMTRSIGQLQLSGMDPYREGAREDWLQRNAPAVQQARDASRYTHQAIDEDAPVPQPTYRHYGPDLVTGRMQGSGRDPATLSPEDLAILRRWINGQSAAPDQPK